jgi:hypothetical protein
MCRGFTIQGLVKIKGVGGSVLCSINEHDFLVKKEILTPGACTVEPFMAVIYRFS